jgi:hypothetical protein
MNEYAPPVRPRSSLKPLLLAIVAAFVLGAAAVGYFAWKGYIGPRSVSLPLTTEQAARTSRLAAPAPGPMPSASQTATAEVRRVTEVQGGIDQRLAAAEQRIARLDLQAQAASGNAARAEGLLIAFATRRALDRGDPLGYLADQLRLRFGDAQPNSVRTVIEFSEDPVTLDVLLARLDGLEPSLRSSAGQPVFTRLQDELSSLFVIRRESAPSPQPGRRFDRARMFLESGRIDRAIAEIENLPGSANAERWIANARRYERAQDALDLIETAAVQEPRRLRDGSGRPIEQLGPAAATPVMPAAN